MHNIYVRFIQSISDPAYRIFLILIVSFSVTTINAQQSIQQSTDEFIAFRSSNGEVIQLAVAADDDGDGIANVLEINGFTYNPTDGLLAWTGDTNVKYFKTDPLRWSTDGDPYSDYMESTRINMPANVPKEEAHPLVAARPVIIVGMADYDVNIKGEITNTNGGSLTGSYTNETSQTTEKGGEVSASAGWSAKDGLSFGASVTATYSKSNTTTKSSTNGFGSDWNTTLSTNPNEAASLTLRIYMQNLGSAAALDVTPTFNLVIGHKTIATITPEETANILAPFDPRPGANNSNSRYPAEGTIIIETFGNGKDINLTMDELRAIQLGAPLSLVVTQISANVTKWDQVNKEYKNLPWTDFESEIDPVSVRIKANLGDEEYYDYQVYVGEDFNDLGQTFEDVLSLVFDVDKSSGETLIDGRKYPDEWLVSTTSLDVIDKWNSLGRPNNLLEFKLYRNTYMILLSPGSQPEPEVNMAIYGPNLKKVYVSASGGNFPIKSVVAKVSIGGVEREVPLVADENSFFSNEVPFESEAKPNGQVIVTNISDRDKVSSIALPALFKNAADIKANSAFIPYPGGEYLVYPNGDTEKLVKLYCQFFELGEDTVLLDVPKNYIPLAQTGDSVNYVDWWIDGQGSGRTYYNRILLSSDDLEDGNYSVVGWDLDWANGDRPQNWSDIDNLLSFGSIRINGEFQGSAKANIDLTGTPFSIGTDTGFDYGNANVGYSSIKIDESRQTVNVYTAKLDDFTVNATSSVGLTPYRINLDYKRDVIMGTGEITIPGRSVQFSATSGTEGSIVNMGDSYDLDVGSTTTIETWINPDDNQLGIDEHGIILGREKRYLLTMTTDGTIALLLAKDENSWDVYNTHYKARIGEWDHVAVTFDFNTVDRYTVKMYINGNLFRSFKTSGIGEILGDGNAGNFVIGYKGSFNGRDGYYQGSVDELRLWNITRTQEDIQLTMNESLDLDTYATDQSGLVGYWKFEETEDLGIDDDGVLRLTADGSDDIRDYSGNEFHGDLSGDYVGLNNNIVGVDESNKIIINNDFSLHPNYPNPFNPSTVISYNIHEKMLVSLTVYDLLGKEVVKLVNKIENAGYHSVDFNTAQYSLPSGVYFYSLKGEGFTETRKLLLMK
jgi:concanavalin A-like lectin/glucanase superfamily protein/binary toxin B/toxin PA/type IX secretion system substrate protein